MSSSAFPYDLFISYAHSDNKGANEGRVTALVESLKQHYAQQCSDAPLMMFFDQENIRDLDDWKRRIKAGLEQAAVMVAVVSRAYFKSNYCRLEFETFLDFEKQRTWPGQAVAPIYVEEEAEFELDEAIIKDAWRRELKQRQYLDLRARWPEGLQGLQRIKPDVSKAKWLQRIAQLFGLARNTWNHQQARHVDKRLSEWWDCVRDRVRKVRIYRQQPWNLPALGRQFVGRENDIQQLRNQLSVEQTAGLTALHGLGGIGKTTLAYQYCYRYRDDYPGGILTLACEGITTEQQLRKQLTSLAIETLFTELEKSRLQELSEKDPDEAFQRAKLRFENRGATLLVLDNVQAAGWLRKPVRDRTLPSPQHVKVLITTRLGESDLFDITQHLSLDLLPQPDAVELLPGRLRD